MVGIEDGKIREVEDFADVIKGTMRCKRDVADRLAYRVFWLSRNWLLAEALSGRSTQEIPNDVFRSFIITAASEQEESLDVPDPVAFGERLATAIAIVEEPNRVSYDSYGHSSGGSQYMYPGVDVPELSPPPTEAERLRKKHKKRVRVVDTKTDLDPTEG